MILLAVISILVTLITFIYVLFRHYEHQSKKAFAARNLKYVKVGNLFLQTLNNRPVHLIKSAAVRREGRVFGFNMLNKHSIMVADADIVNTILNREFTNFPNRREIPAFNKLLNENVAMVADERWKRLRTIASPAFSIGKLKRMKLCIDETVVTLLKNMNVKVNQSPIQNVKHIFDAFTIDTIIQIAFGIKVDSLNDPTNPLIVNGRAIFQHDVHLKDLIIFTCHFFAPKVAQMLKADILKDIMEFFAKMSGQIMDQKREEFRRHGSNVKANSFIEIMLEAEIESERLNEMAPEADKTHSSSPTKFMTTEEIVSNCLMFFIAGFDTTATALTLATYRLACNQDKQEKLYNEICSGLERIRQESDEETDDPFLLVTYDTLARFEYLSAVINESMRLDSPAIFLERRAVKEMELANGDGSIRFKVFPNDVIHVPIYTIQRDEEYFPNADKFIPERFMDDGFNKKAFLPFGSDPRNCIAKSMALLEAKLALLHVIRLYRFETCDQTEIPLKFFNQLDLITPKSATLKIIKRS